MWQVEVTDTFGGEANYSWVRRGELKVSNDPSKRELVRAAKAWACWTGHRCKVDYYSDTLAVYPAGMCQVMFIHWHEG